MDGEEYRTGSADSENGSDNSYVQVTQEEAQQLGSQEQPPAAPQSELYPPKIPAVDDEEDIYTAGPDEGTPTQEEQPPIPEAKPPATDPYYVESPPEPEEEVDSMPSSPVTVPEPLPSSRVEDVPMSTKPTRPPLKAKGYLKFLNFLHPFALYIIYWYNIKLSAVILGVCLVVLLTLTLNTFIHTIVLLLLSFLVVSLAYIVTKVAIDSFYNKEIKNPFSDYLNRKITLPEEEILEWTEYVVGKLDCYFNTLVRLLLFDNIKASLKFGIALWLLSFVTNCFTLLTSLFLLVILLFSIPPLYERFQVYCRKTY